MRRLHAYTGINTRLHNREKPNEKPILLASLLIFFRLYFKFKIYITFRTLKVVYTSKLKRSIILFLLLLECIALPKCPNMSVSSVCLKSEGFVHAFSFACVIAVVTLFHR